MLSRLQNGASEVFCTGRSYLLWTTSSVEANPLLCKAWTCDDCADTLRRQKVAQIVAGEPNRLLTLTTNPNTETDPDQAARNLRQAFKKLVRQLREMFPRHEIAYYTVFERTKKGWPHLHVAMRAPYVAQAWLSDFMKQETGAPIVDIRAVKAKRDVARYMGKYLAKNPHRFTGCNRITCSRNWFDPIGGRHAWKTDQGTRKLELCLFSISHAAQYLRSLGLNPAPTERGWRATLPRGPGTHAAA